MVASGQWLALRKMVTVIRKVALCFWELPGRFQLNPAAHRAE